MSRSADVVIVGLGAMGAAAARALSRRGLSVIGLDRFAPPHAFGSSHGDTRIIREAYFEHPSYVPLVQRAYLLWEELERECSRPLLSRTGGMMIGPRDGELVRGALASAEAHGLPHEVLDAEGIARRAPAFRPRAGWVGCSKVALSLIRAASKTVMSANAPTFSTPRSVRPNLAAVSPVIL